MSRSKAAMQAVREALEGNPDASTQELFERAKEADTSIEDLSLRQFNARYPLQVKRQMRAEEKETGETAATKPDTQPAGPGGDRREAIRSGLLSFARDLSVAEGKVETIDVLNSVDAYVDEVIEGLSG